MWMCGLFQNIPPPVDGDLRQLYEKSFQPLLVERRLFNKFVKHAVKLELEKGKRYSVEGNWSNRRKIQGENETCGLMANWIRFWKCLFAGITMADERVSILLSGRLQVTCENVLLHYIQPTEFVDSPEYESCPQGTLLTIPSPSFIPDSILYRSHHQQSRGRKLRKKINAPFFEKNKRPFTSNSNWYQPGRLPRT